MRSGSAVGARLMPAAVAVRTWSVGRSSRLLAALVVGAALLLVAQPEESASMLLRVLAGLSRIADGSCWLARRSDSSRGRLGATRRPISVPRPGSTPGCRRARCSTWPGGSPRLSHEMRRRIEGGREHTDLAGSPRPADDSRRRAGLVQRVGLASAMLTEPEVLLLDEPLRAVDPEERARPADDSRRRRTVVIASRYPASEAGICSGGRALRATVGLAFAAPLIGSSMRRGLPLSMRGIEALAAASEQRAGG